MNELQVKNIEKEQGKWFVIGDLVIVFSVGISVFLCCYLNMPAFVILMIVGIFCGLGIMGFAPPLNKCNRCGEYYQHSHTEEICLRILKSKLKALNGEYK
jgi:hypothetical protein